MNPLFSIYCCILCSYLQPVLVKSKCFVTVEVYDYHSCDQNGQVTQGKCSLRKYTGGGSMTD